MSPRNGAKPRKSARPLLPRSEHSLIGLYLDAFMRRLRAPFRMLLVLSPLFWFGACQSKNVSTQLATDAESNIPKALFRDVTDESGVMAKFVNGEEADRYSILEVMGGGCAVLDYDGDGLLDLFFPCGGYFDGPDRKTIRGMPPKLFRNLGDFKFKDATNDAGLNRLANGNDWFYGEGASACDYDLDGWPDLLMTGYGRTALWHNESDGNGGRVFREVTAEAGLPVAGFWSMSAAWGDLDGDGLPDLYICHYLDWSNEKDPKCPGSRSSIPRDICTPRQFASKPHLLFRNLGNGKFAEVAASVGIRSNRPDGVYGKGLGCLIADLDGDGRNDLYVCNDGEDNFLYLNRSQPGKLAFEEKGLQSGSARDIAGMANGSMGVDIGDVDGSGRPAIWVTNYENEFHALYQLRPGKGLFFDIVSPRLGLTSIGTKFVGFGTAFIDADLDGWEDIVIANGHVIRHSPTDNVRQRPIFFRNQAGKEGRTFVDSPKEGGPFFDERRIGRGIAVADLNNDGRPDLIYCHINENVRILKNEAPAERRWLGIQAIGADRRDATGAKLTLQTNEREIVRVIAGGRSYLSSSDPRRIFGLGNDQSPKKLTVEWPSGTPRRETWENLEVNRYHTIRQGTGKMER